LEKTDIISQLTKEITLFNLTVKQYLQARLRENDIDLTFEMLQILYFLWKKDGINQQEIANATAKDKASVTYVLDNLVKRALIYRQEGEDRRNKLIYLTREGKFLKRKIQPWIDEMQLTAGKNITNNDAEHLISIIEKIRNNLSG